MKNKKLFLNIARDGKGLSKESNLKKSGLKRFFLTYKDNFGKITSLNIFMVIGNFPLIFLIATLSGFTKNMTTEPAFDIFQNLAGYFSNTSPSAHSMGLFAHEGIQNIVYLPSVWTYIFYGISALTLFTFGAVNIGTAYIFRNIAKGEPVFLWADFWYAIKRNIKQALPFGMIDAAINALLIWNIYSMFINSGSNLLTDMLFWSNIILFLLYFIMRFYIYIQMVTFSLSTFKILKNSLIFALLGFKRNILAVLGVLVLLFIEFMCIFSLGGILLPVAIALPFLILLSTMSYMKVYAAYFKMKEVMIDPYYDSDVIDADRPSDEEAIMRDDVTERERLEKIKKQNQINN